MGTTSSYDLETEKLEAEVESIRLANRINAFHFEQELARQAPPPASILDNDRPIVAETMRVDTFPMSNADWRVERRRIALGRLELVLKLAAQRMGDRVPVGRITPERVKRSQDDVATLPRGFIDEIAAVLAELDIDLSVSM